MNLYLIILVYILLSVYEIVSLAKAKQKKQLIFFSITMAAAFVLSILIALDIEILSIHKLIGDFVLSITGEG